MKYKAGQDSQNKRILFLYIFGYLQKYTSLFANAGLFKETLLALVRDLFTFSSKVIKRFIIV
jgi:hypothetical protein